MITHNRRNLLIVDRVMQGQIFKIRAQASAQHFKIRNIPARHNAFDHGRSQNHTLGAVARVNLNQRIVQISVERYCLVGGDGPGRGGPDNHGNVAFAFVSSEQRQGFGLIDGSEAHINLRRGFVLVLHFGLCQRGLTHHTPVNRFETTNHVPFGDDLAQSPHNARFHFWVHGEVGFVPLTHDAKADKISFLAGDLLRGVITASLAEGFVVDFHTGLTNFLLNLVLNRQTVAIPARHVGRIEAHETAGFNDHILQNLVDRVTNVNVAVGVGRAIVEDELFTPFTLLAQVGVYIKILPALEHFRLAYGQAGFHLKVSFRQVQGMLVVAHGLCAYSFGQFGSVMLCQPRSCGVEISGYLRFKRVDGFKLFFIPQSVAENNVNMLAVKCASKVKQVHFQCRLLAINRRAQANVCDAVLRASVFQRHANNVHAAQGRHLPEQNIRRGRSDTSSQLPAINNTAPDAVGAPKQRLGLFELVIQQQVTNSGATYPLACNGNGAGVLDGEAGGFAYPFQQCKVPGPIAAEAKIIAHNKVAHRQPVDKNIVYKAHSGVSAEVLIELQTEHDINARCQQSFQFLPKPHQPGRRVHTLEELPWQRLKNHDNRG